MGRALGRLKDHALYSAQSRVHIELCTVVLWDPVSRTYTILYLGETMTNVPALGLPTIAAAGANARLQLVGNTPVGVLPL